MGYIPEYILRSTFIFFREFLSSFSLLFLIFKIKFVS